ncbi:hypothetical protein [Vibrio viridaestus]|uniref:Type II CBASS E2 protein domain-containing protein n=1 Tax=Vibrio viridaestus TaxID=2487322 RepID=A0A3N9TE81_9VIBR|nr:hypothetical protein [Vibrio viridaestus]RQW62537.1 hypothetical protein EES38_12485 [Vibrio viridaestus]
MAYVLRSQLNALIKRYPTGRGRIIKVKGGLQLEWRQQLQPTRFARKYEVLVRWYGINDIPDVEILSPNLQELANGKRSPHEFLSKKNTKPCLMFNGKGSKDWTFNMLIAESIIPWTMEWLYYWELWLSDGEWRGGGVHPGELMIEQYKERLQSSKGAKSKDKFR